MAKLQRGKRIAGILCGVAASVGIAGNIILDGDLPGTNVVHLGDRSVAEAVAETEELSLQTEFHTETEFLTATGDAEDDTVVWVSKSGTKYHLISDCSNMKDSVSMTVAEAEASGRTLCSKCRNSVDTNE